jgi:cyclopropane fatty-acyl-phospholipid synthase-like methyltransferase
MSRASISEDRGLALLTADDRKILSVGISTAGTAEIRMARMLYGRSVVATTLDTVGAAQTRCAVADAGLTDQIEVKVEDVAGGLLYSSGEFDFVYARLVLHYLTQQQLSKALMDLQRVLRKGGRIFVVVRSADCPEAMQPENTTDEHTHLTSYTSFATGKTEQRYFHTRASIAEAVQKAGFTLVSRAQYKEALSHAFDRQDGRWIDNNLIEVVARKD